MRVNEGAEVSWGALGAGPIEWQMTPVIVKERFINWLHAPYRQIGVLGNDMLWKYPPWDS
jgi:hypothetical protein